MKTPKQSLAEVVATIRGGYMQGYRGLTGRNLVAPNKMTNAAFRVSRFTGSTIARLQRGFTVAVKSLPKAYKWVKVNARTMVAKVSSMVVQAVKKAGGWVLSAVQKATNYVKTTAPKVANKVASAAKSAGAKVVKGAKAVQGKVNQFNTKMADTFTKESVMPGIGYKKRQSQWSQMRPKVVEKRAAKLGYVEGLLALYGIGKAVDAMTD